RGVRNLEPKTPRRRSAKSLSRFRPRTNVSATKRRKMSAESAAKIRVCWLERGLRNVRLNAVCDTRIASSRKMPEASKMMAFLRLEVFCTGRVGVGPATLDGLRDLRRQAKLI